MRTNIPAFRLPANVLNEEIGYIVQMGADLRLNSPIDSMKKLLDSRQFAAVFVGSGAPKGKELDLPGRHDSDRIHIASLGSSRWRSGISTGSASGCSSSGWATPRWIAAGRRCASCAGRPK